MNINELLKSARLTWGDDKLKLDQVIIRLNVTLGDLARIERNSEKDRLNSSETEVKKELGNIIYSTIRWCDDLGYDPEECIELAKKAQEKFAKENETR